jgi:archaellum biogenesis ATPase FlaH
MSWINPRHTKLEEDKAYSLLGIFDVEMPRRYGERFESAFKRLEEEIEKQNKCIRDLRLTDPHHDKKRIEGTNGGLLKDSYRWILFHSNFRQWRYDQQGRLLWIKGDPGKGKTMLLCGIINELKTSISETDLLSYFFCQAIDSRINNATAVLRGLLYLLIDQQPSLISHIQKKHDRAGKALFEDANAWVALSEIFTDILQDPRLNNTYFIIDALDECITDLPKLLDFIVKKSSISRCVKWIVSSRNWPAIEERLGRTGHKVRLCLELNTESISVAVRKFIEYKVLQLVHRKKYDRNTQNAVFNHLSSNANYTFLWVALVCQNLEKISRWETLTKLNEFPPGLNSLYKRMMRQICNSDKASLCKQILALVAIVYRPITLQELTSLVEMLEDMADDLESIREIISLCGSFLTIREGTIYFVHQSAKDFLFKEEFDEIFPSGSKEVHYIIFSRTLQVLSRTLRRDIYSLHALGYPIERAKPPDPDPLATSRYSCIY